MTTQENQELRAELVPLSRFRDLILDVDTMRAVAPEVRAGLIDNLRSAVTAMRAERGTVVTPEDTYELIRRVTAAEEVLRQWAQAFTAAAECVAIAEEEALTANGGLPGYEEAPAGSLFVPDGVGQRIAVRPDWKPGESTWDVATLVGWLIDDEVADAIAVRRDELGSDERVQLAEAAREVAQDVVARLLSLGRFTPAATKIEALRKKLAEQQRDTDAAVLRQVRTVGPRKYAGVRVTREEA
jgi:hypothetical protein